MFASKLWTIKYRALIPEKTFDLSQETIWKPPNSGCQDAHGVNMEADEKKMREALIACRQYVKHCHGSWWNDRRSCDLMTKVINPALGLDAWSDEWLETNE
jgi:hypothetical protein